MVRERVRAAFETVLQGFLRSAPIERLLTGQVGLAHYKAFLRETYFYTREDPQVQAWSTAWFRGSSRVMVKPFLRHAMSEIGHDQLALNDLAALGADVSQVPQEYPLPATTAFIAFPFWAIQFRNPLSYLGYLYFLEAMPVANGGAVLDALTDLGVPPEAMTFIRDHTTIDVAHVRLMDGYLDTLVKDERDLSDIVYAIAATAKLYVSMLEAAFAAADEGTAPSSIDTGEYFKPAGAAPSVVRGKARG